MLQIESARLIFIPLSAELVKLALYDRSQLGKTLHIAIPDNWPDADFATDLPIILEEVTTEPTREVWDGLIILKEPRVLIGAMGFKGGPDLEGTVEIGYGILPEYWNKGYVTEMASALIAWAFEQGGIERVIADCLDDNIGSIRVLEKLGMRRLAPDGHLLNWTLSKHEWKL